MTTISTESRSVAQMTDTLLTHGDPVAQNIYWTGHRAGVASERARVQMIASEFTTDLGPSPALQPRLRAVGDQGSPEAGRALVDAAVAAWRALYADGRVAA